MISVRDFIRLPYTPDLTEAGIAFALRSLPHTFDRANTSPYDRLRRAVASVAVELAFRRYLGEQNIPFEVQSAAPFTEPDRYDVILGGRRCEIKSFLISHLEQADEMKRNPAVLLDAPALVPSDQHAGDGHSENDLYLFAFISGHIAASQDDLRKVAESKQPHYLLHVMGEEWRKPLNWNPLGRLALKSESEEEMLVEINGQAEGREFVTRLLNLPPQTRVLMEDPFYSLTSVHVHRPPKARLGIRCEAREKTYLISPLEWGNIQVYGMDIYLAGYLLRGEFSRKAAQLPPNSRVFQYNRTHVKNLVVPVSDLKSLSGLFEKARQWNAPDV